MKGGYLGLVLVVCLSFALVEGAVVFPEYSDDGFDVIWLDTPSFLSELHHSNSEHLLYIFGENRLRLVNTTPFAVTDIPAADWHQPFISFVPFHVNNDLWGVGPSFSSDTTNITEGYTLPLALVGPNFVQSQRPLGLDGNTFYSVFVDPRDLTDVLSYFVGWIQQNATQGNNYSQVALGVVRAHISFNDPPNQRYFTYDPTVDVAILSYNHYNPYSQHFRPQVHYSNTSNILTVIDPNGNVIYNIPVTGPRRPFGTITSSRLNYHGFVTSSWLHSANNVLYVGFAAQGVSNGTVAMIDVGTLNTQHVITFKDRFLSNPRALAFDDVNDTLYIGFDGADILIKTDYLLNIEGFQRVPDYLTHLERGAVGRDHVYFITNEQHSKVIRTRKEDFCKDPCPYLGYCVSGKCVCPKDRRVSKDGYFCEVAAGASKKEKGAAAALGVFFALSFVGGAVGWYQYYRLRKGYTSISS